ncbi:hypothetical protein BG003_008521 [Podila horticola]|nr:hypothetical protein BG003_008521 [Podila horticola]
MPSVISPSSSHSSSEIDFVPDDLYYDHSHASHSPKGSSATDSIKEFKQQQRWSDPEDEFSVPIHTESPLIAKKGPLGMSSFLLNYRAMHRSIEIMTPPSQHSTKSSSDSTTPLHPTMPDGPFYIHHRSTKADSPLTSVVSCSHVHCFQHNHHPYNVSRTGQCQDSRRLLSTVAPVAPGSSHQSQDEEPSSSSSSSRSSSRSHSRTPSSSGSDGHSLLENHIASIGHWLSLNS